MCRECTGHLALLVSESQARKGQPSKTRKPNNPKDQKPKGASVACVTWGDPPQYTSSAMDPIFVLHQIPRVLVVAGCVDDTTIVALQNFLHGSRRYAKNSG